MADAPRSAPLMDFVKILLPVFLAATLGQWLAHNWQNARQARDQDIATAAKLHELYGRFFALWKRWRAASYITAREGDEEVAEILALAIDAEGEMEALLVRFASERCLNDVQVDRLGAMRQAYQRLRESIEGTRRRSLSERKCSWHPEYIAMKALATETAVIAATSRTRRLGLVVRRPDARAAKKSLLMLTSNYYEARWITIGLEAAEEQHLLHPWDRERYGQPCTPGSRRN